MTPLVTHNDGEQPHVLIVCRVMCHINSSKEMGVFLKCGTLVLSLNYETESRIKAEVDLNSS